MRLLATPFLTNSTYVAVSGIPRTKNLWIATLTTALWWLIFMTWISITRKYNKEMRTYRFQVSPRQCLHSEASCR